MLILAALSLHVCPHTYYIHAGVQISDTSDNKMPSYTSLLVLALAASAASPVLSAELPYVSPSSWVRDRAFMMYSILLVRKMRGNLRVTLN